MKCIGDIIQYRAKTVLKVIACNKSDHCEETQSGFKRLFEK